MAKKKWTEPELMSDDHNGRYMGQHVWKTLAERYKIQARTKLSAEDIASLEAGPDDEFYDEACDNLTNVNFRTETGQKFTIQYAEGGMWAIPACFRGEKAEKFFGA